ncbi:MAG: UDP-N-acetylmuramoylalanyl-D-glutamate--2,6-diaminopimelate ligase [Gammaproteobacteria bacterium HGW-Gammaproteobacteria-3]|nr:MAG: UDP-N-acetylmuramoylalanyl-D-glutamate--2,6-diaminopimelate ligase [Gammaproteobacteria bacterium HGW-Gammaproteobacteria-3]
MNLQLSAIAEAVGGVLEGQDVPVSKVGIDTRTLVPGALYCTIKGERFDGHDFVVQAEQAGAIAVLASKKMATSLPTVIVNDTRLALAELARLWRQKANVKVVGITGSNGKTTVKEMVAAVLGGDASVLFTQGNLNNDIGVPLTLLRLNDAHRFAVIEMGANHAGEIAYTSHYAEPDVSMITNAGPAHLEGFGSLDGVAGAKGEIIDALAPDGVALLNFDDVYFNTWRARAGKRPVISFGLNEGADISARNIKSTLQEGEFVTTFDLIANSRRLPVQIGLAGRHNVINALAAAAAGLALGVSPESVKRGLAAIKPVTGRLQPLPSRVAQIVIDDTYNANAASLAAGLDVLRECSGEPWVVLGAFGELGPDSGRIHQEIGVSIKACGVKRLLATGELARHTVQAFGAGGAFFTTQQALIDMLKQELTGREAVLVKGSRVQHMERVVSALVENFRN